MYLVLLFGSAQDHSPWEDAEHVPRAETGHPHSLPLPPILCFPEPSSSYKILSCGVTALLTADNGSHFIIHTGKGGGM